MYLANGQLDRKKKRDVVSFAIFCQSTKKTNYIEREAFIVKTHSYLCDLFSTAYKSPFYCFVI